MSLICAIDVSNRLASSPARYSRLDSMISSIFADVSFIGFPRNNAKNILPSPRPRRRLRMKSPKCIAGSKPISCSRTSRTPTPLRRCACNSPSVKNCWCAQTHVPPVCLQSSAERARWRRLPGSPRGIPLEHGICRRKCVSISVYIYVVPRPAAEHRSIGHLWIIMNRLRIISGQHADHERSHT